jgi:flagellar L-ring protein FlgH
MKKLKPKFLMALAAMPVLLFGAKAKKPTFPVEGSAIDRYIEEAARRRGDSAALASPGSLFISNGGLADLSADDRARHVDDMVTITVDDRASALNSAGTNTSRKSSAANSITALAGKLNPAGALANLATLSNNQQIQGTGQTTRTSSLTTTISARVTHVLPNGYLVVEGLKDISVNSERQTVVVRGIIRPLDLNALNTIASDRLADLEIHVNGKGVVGDAVKRPFILYRILLGLLPF